MKDNDIPSYVHCKSNHPPSILRNIPASINKRLSTISANKQVFDEAVPVYQEALKKSGYDYKLEYEKQTSTETKRKTRTRKRTITWFNPPFSQEVKTNIGGRFLRLIDECFPKGTDLGKLINRNNVKISYSCLPNLESMIAKHNAKIAYPRLAQEEKLCNCRKKDECPLDGKCLSSNIIYQATVTTENGSKDTYVGLTANTFKQRLAQHKSSFKNKAKKGETTLSQHIWSLKDKNVSHNIKWKIISKAKSFSPITEKCYLCTKEKSYIIFKPKMCSLNTRNELATHCRHKNRMLLENT